MPLMYASYSQLMSLARSDFGCRCSRCFRPRALGLTSYLPWTTVALDDMNLAVIGLSAVILENVGLRPAIPPTARIAVRVSGTNRMLTPSL